MLMTYDEDGIVRVLVIDDHEDLRALITRLLHDEGCQVVPVATAEAGLEQLPYGRFDVAFVDQNLPGMEGLVFGEYLRGNNPDMQIVLVTGASEPQIERAARDMNLGFIAKPFDPEQLFAFVDRAKAASRVRSTVTKQRASPNWAAGFAAHMQGYEAWYRLPQAPQRLRERLNSRVRDAVSELRNGDFSEVHRSTALAGLLTARVLGIRLAPWSDDLTLEEAFDEVMLEQGLRPEFSDSVNPGD